MRFFLFFGLAIDYAIIAARKCVFLFLFSFFRRAIGNAIIVARKCVYACDFPVFWREVEGYMCIYTYILWYILYVYIYIYAFLRVIFLSFGAKENGALCLTIECVLLL